MAGTHGNFKYNKHHLQFMRTFTAIIQKDEDVYVCGGASIYRQTINRVNTLYITRVNMKPDGDVFFPEIDPAIWQETWREDHDGFSFLKFNKK